MQKQLEAMLERGQDGPLLRFTLGELLYKNHEPDRAVPHLAEAVRLDPAYSAAWKLYGQALAATDDLASAIDTLTRGIEIANANGDNQAAREMQVHLKRARRRAEQDN